MEEIVLVVNIGSSSKKYALMRGQATIHIGHFEHVADGYQGGCDDENAPLTAEDYTRASERFLTRVKEKSGVEPTLVGVRIVAPGTYFTAHHVIDDDFMQHLAKAAAEDPVHIGAVHEELIALRALLPTTPMLGASDSAFHHPLPETARLYALPREVAATYDLYRFGYHGLSVGAIVRSLSARPQGIEPRVIVCHLGSGASVTALKDGKSIDTSMGYSPVEGLIMSSRVGFIDPGAVLRMAEVISADALHEMFYAKSGLLALSEKSNDMRVLLQGMAAGDEACSRAIALFVYVVRKYIGAYAAALGGLDAIVFSGTMGELAHPIRERVCQDFEWLNVRLDAVRNMQAVAGDTVHAEGSIPVYVIKSDEAGEIARAALAARA